MLMLVLLLVLLVVLKKCRIRLWFFLSTKLEKKNQFTKRGGHVLLKILARFGTPLVRMAAESDSSHSATNISQHQKTNHTRVSVCSRGWGGQKGHHEATQRIFLIPFLPFLTYGLSFTGLDMPSRSHLPVHLRVVVFHAHVHALVLVTSRGTGHKV